MFVYSLYICISDLLIIAKIDYNIETMGEKKKEPEPSLTINLHPSDIVVVSECDLPPGRGVVAADVAGEAVSVHPQGRMVGFPVFSVSGEITDGLLRYDV